MSEKNPKISVLNKMTSASSKVIQECIVPQNSTSNLCKRHGFSEVTTEEAHMEPRKVPCPHCENMAKNFLYLESLIRFNFNKNQKCELCDSALKYLQFVNRNIMQVFGSYESITSAAREFQKNPPHHVLQTKVSQAKVSPSSRMIAGSTRTKATKHSKPLKGLKSTKSSSHKLVKKHDRNLGVKEKVASKLATKMASKMAITRGKASLVKGKKSAKPIKLNRSLSQVVRSASQYGNLRIKRKTKRPKKSPVTRGELINWRLLKENIPKRKGLKKYN